MAKNHGADFLVGGITDVSKKMLDAAEQFLEYGEGGRQLAASVARVAQGADALLTSGLTKRGICVLLQDRLGKGPGGKPAYSIETLDKMLTELASLGQFLEAPKAKK
jgi:hypothetical protein